MIQDFKDFLFLYWHLWIHRAEFEKQGFKVSFIRGSIYYLYTFDKPELAENAEARSQMLLEEAYKRANKLWYLPKINAINQLLEPRFYNINLLQVLVRFHANFVIRWHLLKLILLTTFIYYVYQYIFSFISTFF